MCRALWAHRCGEGTALGFREAIFHRGPGPGVWRPAYRHEADVRNFSHAACAISGDAADLLLSDLSRFLPAAAMAQALAAPASLDFEHDLFRKPDPTPDHVRGHDF